MSSVLLLFSSAIGSIAAVFALIFEAGWAMAALSWIVSGVTGIAIAAGSALRQG